MSFLSNLSFSSVFNAIESLFKIGVSAPAVVAQSADQIVTAAAPVIDELAGAGTSAKITSQIDHTKDQALAFVTPHLQEAAMAETVVRGLATIFASGTAQAAQTAVSTGALPVCATQTTTAPAAS